MKNRMIESDSRGAAILTVLAVLALLVAILMVFLTRVSFNRETSFADLNRTKADWLARGALETVIADLRQEMRDHSDSSATQPDRSELFEVSESVQMRPTRMLKDSALLADTNYRNLLKQSAHGNGFSSLSEKVSGKLRRASAVSTSIPALSGRRIPADRWRLPLLYDPLDESPLASAQLPDWIYLARDGSNPIEFFSDQVPDLTKGIDGEFSPNLAHIVGRYAFQIYDVSGLLDLNVAGHDPEQTPADDIARKGSLLYADLAQLPGASSAIGDLPLWRNRLLEDWGDSAREMIETTGRVDGWLRPQIKSGDNDNLFLSRQDLLAFHFIRSEVLPREALPFVTHFSRSINSPLLRPGYDASDLGGEGSTFDYSSNASDTANPNPDVLKVRVIEPFTRRDGTEAERGSPLMETRFPLSKIDLFLNPAENADAIAEWFGLENAGTAQWTYQQYGESDDGADRILTLGEIAQEGREPNFFEVLNAGILSGSLGGSDSRTWYYRHLNYDVSATRHVLRLGACIIDQWDSDNNPTVIFPPNDGILINPSEQVLLAGVENIPYVDIIGQEHIVRYDLEGFPEWPWVSGFYKLQIWNPHREALSAQSGEYRAVLQGEPRVRIGLAPGGTWWSTRAKYWVESEGLVSDEKNNFIEFRTPLPEAERPWVDKPQQLMGSMIYAASEQNTIPEGGTKSSPFVGLHLGKVKTDDHPHLPVDHRETPSKTWPGWGHGQGHIRYNQPVTVRLEKKIGEDWVPYQWIPRIERHHGNIPWSSVPSSMGHPENTAKSGVPSLRISYDRPDPRSIRYGMGSTGGGGSPRCVNDTAYNAFLTIGHGHAVPNHVGGEGSVFGHWFRLAANDPEFGPKIYTHPDGVLRPGDVTGAQPFDFAGDASSNDGRPHILNRPFVSLGEMGLAFRDEPFKSIDFVSSNSPDSGLLELFSLSESPVVAGVLQPSGAAPEVLRAVLAGAGKSIARGSETELSEAEVSTLADTIANSPPMLDLSSLGRMELSPESDNHEHRELIVRALGDVTNVRTWNLLIDVVGQSGKLARIAEGLEDFVVEGERRYWLHLAIDRLTGSIVDSQLEMIHE